MNAVERAVVTCPFRYGGRRRTGFSDGGPSAFRRTLPEWPRRRRSLPLEAVEKQSILEAMKAAGGNKSEAARRLGITRKTLRKKLEKYESANEG